MKLDFLDEDCLKGPELFPVLPVKNKRKKKKKYVKNTLRSTDSKSRNKSKKKVTKRAKPERYFCKFCERFACKFETRNIKRHKEKCTAYKKAKHRSELATKQYKLRRASQMQLS